MWESHGPRQAVHQPTIVWLERDRVVGLGRGGAAICSMWRGGDEPLSGAAPTGPISTT